MSSSGDDGGTRPPPRGITVTAGWSGPLPAPRDLAAFEEVVPGGAARIFDQFEREADHRRDLERSQVRFVVRETHIGQALAGLFAAAGLGLTGYAIHEGAEWAASILGAGVLVPIVVAFLRRSEWMRPRD